MLFWVRPMLPHMVALIGTAGFFGLSMLLASFSDFFSCLTAHINVVYAVIRIAFRNQLTLAQSLFNLFRGKRLHAECEC